MLNIFYYQIIIKNIKIDKLKYNIDKLEDTKEIKKQNKEILEINK